MSAFASTAFSTNAFSSTAFSFDNAAPVVVTPQSASNWQVTHKRRLTKEELRELIRQERIALGILPPDLPGQAIAEPEDIAEQVAAAVNDQIVQAEIPIDYRTIYKEAFKEAETAIAEYRKLKRRRRAAITLLLH